MKILQHVKKLLPLLFICIQCQADDSGVVDALVGLGGNYGTRLGGRIGYVLPYNVYMGAAYSHFFGNSVPAVVPGVGWTATQLNTGSNVITAEFGIRGYAFLPQIELVPYVGAGAAIFDLYTGASNSILTTGQTTAKAQFIAMPGIRGSYLINVFSIGVDLNYLLSANYNAFSTSVIVGVRF
jgi:hypothetical protein